MARRIRVVLVLAVAGLALLLTVAYHREKDSEKEIAEESTQGSPVKPVPKDIEQLRDGFRPLTAGEVQLYLEVLRAAAERCPTLKPAYKAAIAEQERQTKKEQDWQHAGHVPTAAETQAGLDAWERVEKLAAVDILVAEERHIKERYEAIKAPVERVALSAEARGEVGEGEEYKPTAEEAKKWAAYDKVMEANKKVLAPYLSEMEKLHSTIQAYKSLRGF